MSGNHDSAGDEDADDEGYAEALQHEIDYEPSNIGNRELKRQRAAEVIKGIMQQSGWSEALGTRLLQHKEPPSSVKTAAQWKGDVKQMRQNILDQSKRNVIDVEEEAHHVLISSQNTNQVKIVDKSYLERRQHSVAHKVIIDLIVIKFLLNKEQERAFQIAANHACNSYSEQLKMYIGGMGGTGKTQVLKSLTEFFKITNQTKRFVVVAPTGSAAALLGGSTYHYLFGFGDQPDDNIPPQLLLQLRARFEGVNYIFLDEVSMLSCHDMYRISSRLSKILNVSDLPFGGMNMLFAGDFAQLPPAIGQEHSALYSRTVGNKSTSPCDQEAAIGKALWQQVTTVVILRQNMRQKNQSKEDTALRQALSNMHFGIWVADNVLPEVFIVVGG